MSAPAASASRPGPTCTESEVSLARLYLLRATYLLLVIGLGAMIVPPLINHAPMARGVIPSLLGSVWLLAFIGLKYPLQMLPLLMFEFAWKTTWLLAFGLPQRFSGQMHGFFTLVGVLPGSEAGIDFVANAIERQLAARQPGEPVR